MLVVVDACVVVVLDVVLLDGGSMVDDVVVVGSAMQPPGVPIGGHSAFGTNVPGPPPHRSHVAGLTFGPLTQLLSGQLQQPDPASVVVVGIDVVLFVVVDAVVVVGSLDDVATVVVVSVVGVLGSVVDVVVKSVVVELVVLVVVLVVGPTVVVVTGCVVVETVVVGRLVVGIDGSVVEGAQKSKAPGPSQINAPQQLPLSPLQAPPSGLQHRPSSHSVNDTPPGDDPGWGQHGSAPQASPRSAQTRHVDCSARKAEVAPVLQAPVSRCLVVLHDRRHVLPAFFFGQACRQDRKPLWISLLQSFGHFAPKAGVETSQSRANAAAERACIMARFLRARIPTPLRASPSTARSGGRGRAVSCAPTVAATFGSRRGGLVVTTSLRAGEIARLPRAGPLGAAANGLVGPEDRSATASRYRNGPVSDAKLESN